MEKLLELLNEYESGWSYDDYYGPFQYGQDSDAYHLCKYQLVSKEYGFIKRLVENDKIDLEKIEKKFYNEICITDYGDKDRAYGKSDLIISVLSISDTPIEDLILYLK